MKDVALWGMPFGNLSLFELIKGNYSTEKYHPIKLGQAKETTSSKETAQSYYIMNPWTDKQKKG